MTRAPAELNPPEETPPEVVPETVVETPPEENKGGRPSIYTEELFAKAREYLENLPKDEVIHSIEGLADYINVSRSNIYLWSGQEDKKEFSDILEQVREKQAKGLINKGLSGKFNAPITKVMLTKHGYRDASEIDHTSKGEKIGLSEEDRQKLDALLPSLPVEEAKPVEPESVNPVCGQKGCELEDPHHAHAG